MYCRYSEQSEEFPFLSMKRGDPSLYSEQQRDEILFYIHPPK